MKYRVDINGAYIFHDFGEHSVNEMVWKEADGRFEKRTDGSYYTYYNEDGSVNLILENLKTAEQLEAERKAEIAQQLETLTVTTSKGNTFDANNQARLDMQNGIEAAKTTKELIDLGVLPAETEWETTKWRLANDSEVVITLIELKEASLLAIKKYAEVKGIGA